MINIKRDAGSLVIYEHIRSFQRLGLTVVFATTDTSAQSLLQIDGVKSIFISDDECIDCIIDNYKVKIAYLHRFAITEKFLNPIIENHPQVRIIYNLADLHFLRHERMAAYYDLPFSMRDRGPELSAARFCDVVMVHSPYEATILADYLGGQNVVVAPWAISVEPETISFEQKSGICFIGGYRHLPNVDAARYFVTQYLPRLRLLDTSIELDLIGSDMPDLIRNISAPGCKVIGYVDSVFSHLAARRVTVAPLRFGAGIKGKVLASFAAKTPCVMSSVAAEGLPLSAHARKILVHDDEQSFVEAITRIYHDQRLNSWIASECAEIVKTYYSTDRTDLALARAINLARNIIRK